MTYHMLKLKGQNINQFLLYIYRYFHILWPNVTRFKKKYFKTTENCTFKKEKIKDDVARTRKCRMWLGRENEVARTPPLLKHFNEVSSTSVNFQGCIRSFSKAKMSLLPNLYVIFRTAHNGWAASRWTRTWRSRGGVLRVRRECGSSDESLLLRRGYETDSDRET